jgi:hypothetical protein
MSWRLTLAAPTLDKLAYSLADTFDVASPGICLPVHIRALLWTAILSAANRRI